MAKTPPPRVTYVWLTGQQDNIGDSVLRRAYADALRESRVLRVWAGDPTSGYISGLGLRDGELVVSRIRWYLTLFGDAARGRADFAFNAGEYSVTRESFRDALLLLPALLLLRLRRGQVVWMGAAIRRTVRGFTWPARFIARVADPLYWRDGSSGGPLSVSGGVMPDWAFALPATGASGENEANRDKIAISMRGDRPSPSSEWIVAVQTLIHNLGLTPVLVAQVERDRTRASELSDSLGASVFAWVSDEHEQQEAAVRKLYAESAIVLSDRLHALIMGATEGAVPLGWTLEPNAKVERHFAVVELGDVSLSGDLALAALNSLGSQQLIDRQAQLESALASARERLREVTTQAGTRSRHPGTIHGRT